MRSLWLACRKPLLVAFIFGCAVSLMTAGRLTLRLLLPAMVYWSFVPLVQIAGLAAVWRRKESALAFSQFIDRFFVGHVPLSLWVILFAAQWAFFPPALVYQWTQPKWAWNSWAGAILIWSGYVDYRFLRGVSAHPGRALLVQRAVSWSLGIAWFVAPAAWSEIASRLGGI